LRSAFAARSALLAVAVAACGCTGLPWREDVATVTVRRGDLEVLVPAEGSLEATQASPVAVPRVPTGALKVKEIVAEGTTVEPGDVVVVFDDTQLHIELSNHQATFRSAGRRLDRNDIQDTIERGSIAVIKSTAELEREHVDEFAAHDPELFSKLEILRDEVRRTEADETIVYADAGLRLRGQYFDIEERILGVERGQAEDRIGRVETSLAQLVLKAPLGGMVIYKKNWRGSSAGVGDTLWPGNVVMSIVDPSVVALKAYVLERDAPGIAAGAPATVVVDAWPDRPFTGKVRSVADLASPIERGSPVKYFETWIDLDAGDPALLKPGMKGRARIRGGEAKDALVVPRAALRGTPEAPLVRVLGRHGREERPVKLGPGDAVRVAVLEGLAEGDRVIVSAEDGPASPAGPPAAGASGPPAS
jgi:HlyD family secretion protein